MDVCLIPTSQVWYEQLYLPSACQAISESREMSAIPTQTGCRSNFIARQHAKVYRSVMDASLLPATCRSNCTAGQHAKVLSTEQRNVGLRRASEVPKQLYRLSARHARTAQSREMPAFSAQAKCRSDYIAYQHAKLGQCKAERCQPSPRRWNAQAKCIAYQHAKLGRYTAERCWPSPRR